MITRSLADPAAALSGLSSVIRSVHVELARNRDLMLSIILIVTTDNIIILVYRYRYMYINTVYRNAYTYSCNVMYMVDIDKHSIDISIIITTWRIIGPIDNNYYFPT